jgi:hypothetical protein
MEPTTEDRLQRIESSLAGLIQTMAVFVQREADRGEPQVLPSVSNPTDPGSPGPAVREIHRDTSSRDHRPKPATPADFLGDRTKGRAFLNSCALYFALAPHQFADEHAQVMWALSFMKGGRAARFVDRLMRNYQLTGRLPYHSYSDFAEEFTNEFCPKNEIQNSRTELKTVRYFQGTRTVDEYVDDFRELVERAQYFEGAHIVLKFRQGLNVKIQDHVACLTTGRPSDDSPKQWYDAAIVCDENRIANEAFRTSSRMASRSDVSAQPGSMFRKPLAPVPRPPPPTSHTTNTSRYTPSMQGVSAPTKPKDASALVCFRCGQPGHTRPECPRRFDVWYIDGGEQQDFAQAEFAALDVNETNEKNEAPIVEVKEDFRSDNE